MSNNKKRAIKARKQKFGESHSTARMHVVRSGGGSGSGGGNGRPPVVEMNYGELERRKDASWEALRAAKTDAERLDAMDAVCHCHWERSMAAAIENEVWKDHPSFEVYACAYDVFDRPMYPRGLWRTRHPFRSVPGMEPGMSYWDAAPKYQQRYYLHGDLREDGTYYCSRCDVFVAGEHKDAHQGERESDVSRLKRQRTQFYGGSPRGFQRPLDAPNIFNDIEPPKFPFREFIMTRRPRDNARGDAIGDTQAVMRGDDRINTVADVRNYMTSRGASHEARVAMRGVFSQYARTSDDARAEVVGLDRRFGRVDG